MILRKPYAFLIKHFKLIHLVITFFMAYCLYKSLNVLSFFGDYVVNESSIVGQVFSDIVFPTMIFVSPVIVIILSLILLGTMAVKHKPFKLYIVNIIIYILTIVMLLLGNSIVVQLEKTLVDIRTVKLVRDLLTILLIIQIYPICKNLVRGVGFDFKQFDFKKDLAELEIEEKDNEEFEVSVSFDINKVKRMINNGTRNFKYFYAEHKFIVNIAASVTIVAIIGLTFLGITKTNNALYYNQPVGMNGLTVKVTNTYITRLDNTGLVVNNLGKNNTLVVIPVIITNNQNTNRELVTANIELRVAGKKYRHISTFRDSIADLGQTYQNIEIEKKSTVKVNLVYEIPTKFIEKSMTLKFITSIDSTGRNLIPTYSNLKLKPINLDINNESKEIIINETTSFKDSVLGESTLLLKNVEIANKFKINYSLCVSKSNCISSYEYLYAPLTSNDDRDLMKINGEVTFDENNKLSNVTYLYDLINTFGSIKYKVGETTKTLKSFYKVNPLATKSNNIIFVSVPNDMKEASSIELLLTIRNKEYKYIIK